MQTTPVQDPRVEFTGFEEEPMIERHSYLYGTIRVYAPLGPTSHWGQLPWLLRTETGGEGKDSPGLRHLIRADAINFCLNHISIVGKAQLWEDPDAEDPLS